MKKGSANMWWIIIGAVIALVVMIILLLLFTGKTGALEHGLLSCEGKGGQCFSGTTCPENTLKSSAFSCPNTPQGAEQVCCLSALKKIGESCEHNDECISGKCTGTPPKCVSA